MELTISVQWTKTLAGDHEVQGALRRMQELMSALGVPRLYAKIPSGFVDVLDSDQFHWVVPNSRYPGIDVHGVRIDLCPVPDKPKDWPRRAMEFFAAYEKALPSLPRPYPMSFDGRFTVKSYEEVVVATERFRHMTMPSLLWVQPDGGRMSFLYLDNEHVRQAEALELGFRPAGSWAGGSWFRAHGETIESTSPEAMAAGRAMNVALDRMWRKRAAEARRRWKKISSRPPAPPPAPRAVAPAPAPAPAVLAGSAGLVASHFDPDGTVMGGAPTSKPLPFQGLRAGPPPSLPIVPSPDEGATVAVPLPKLATPASASGDVDATLPPFRNPLPILPFADRAAAIRDLPLPAYAALRAALSIHGDDDPATLARFELTNEHRLELQERYIARFRANPALQDEFDELFREELRRINRGGDRR